MMEAPCAIFLKGSFLLSRMAHRDGGGSKGEIMSHCLTRSDVTSVERGVRMSQCGQAPLGMRIEGVGDSHFS